MDVGPTFQLCKNECDDHTFFAWPWLIVEPSMETEWMELTLANHM
jgi:hypothetical protein